jgi:hypothetical protein
MKWGSGLCQNPFSRSTQDGKGGGSNLDNGMHGSNSLSWLVGLNVHFGDGHFTNGVQDGLTEIARAGYL